MNSQTLTMFVPLILLIVAMYFLLIRPQKKREREVNNMRANLHVGDEIVTIGGICGKIVKTKDESIVIQVGADKVKMEMMKWSVSKVVNPAEARAARKAERAAKDEVEEEAPKKAMPKRMKKASEEVEEKAEAVEEAVEEKVEAVEETVEAAAEEVKEAVDAE
ncbi:MAG: preprotein translocase subunit YajC [Firmicutes bacterium]|nr:preprotein translocase subunit YajC [Bacillota bacterium]